MKLYVLNLPRKVYEFFNGYQEHVFKFYPSKPEIPRKRTKFVIIKYLYIDNFFKYIF